MADPYNVRKAKSQFAMKYPHKQYCWSCGKTGGRIQISHTLRISGWKKLEDDINNMVYECESCHRNWESNVIKKMASLLTFFDKMAYIAKVDPQHYEHMKHRFKDFDFTVLFVRIKRTNHIHKTNYRYGWPE